MARLFYEAAIPVIRIGLQEAGDEMVAGPFHPAFRDFVDNQVILSWIIDHLEQQLNRQLESTQALHIICPKRWVSVLVGQKKAGLKCLETYAKKVVIETTTQWVNQIQLQLIDDHENKVMWCGSIPVPLKNES